MLVLGIDPGSVRLGWGLVRAEGSRLTAEQFGVLRLGGGKPLHERLGRLLDELSAMVASYRPELVAIETVFHGVNTRALVTLGQARGVVLAVAGQAGLPVFELSPAEVKKAVTGRGGASKEQVAHMVGALLGPATKQALAGHPADASDALAVALAAHHRARAGVP